MFSLFSKFRRYLLVGAFNTLLSLSIMSLGAFWGLHYLLYTAIGYLTTLCISFVMNLKYTFKVNDKHWVRLLGFLLVSITNLVIVETIEYRLIEYHAYPRPYAVLLGMIFYVISGFLCNNFLVYRHFQKKSD